MLDVDQSGSYRLQQQTNTMFLSVSVVCLLRIMDQHDGIMAEEG
jgi:hypothetical protein